MYKYIFQFCVKYLQALADKATGQWATHDFDGFTQSDRAHSSHSQWSVVWVGGEYGEAADGLSQGEDDDE